MDGSTRVARWLRCERKTCCSFSAICLTGDDVVRLARTLSLEPWAFAVAIRAADDADDGFYLDASQQRFRLALRRNDSTCSFLMHVTGDAARCGLGDLRPAACRVFPAGYDGSSLAIEPVGCTCDWSNVALDEVFLHDAFRDVRAQRIRYAGIIGRWNAYVRSAGDAVFTLPDILRFVLDAYAA